MLASRSHRHHHQHHHHYHQEGCATHVPDADVRLERPAFDCITPWPLAAPPPARNDARAATAATAATIDAATVAATTMTMTMIRADPRAMLWDIMNIVTSGVVRDDAAPDAEHMVSLALTLWTALIDDRLEPHDVYLALIERDGGKTWSRMVKTMCDCGGPLAASANVPALAQMVLARMVLVAAHAMARRKDNDMHLMLAAELALPAGAVAVARRALARMRVRALLNVDVEDEALQTCVAVVKYASWVLSDMNQCMFSRQVPDSELLMRELWDALRWATENVAAVVTPGSPLRSQSRSQSTPPPPPQHLLLMTVVCHAISRLSGSLLELASLGGANPAVLHSLSRLAAGSGAPLCVQREAREAMLALHGRHPTVFNWAGIVLPGDEASSA